MACISVAAFQLGCVTVCGRGPDGGDIVAISQSRCTPGDLQRMMAIISAKLDVCHTPPVTPAVFLNLFHNLLLAVDTHGVYSRSVVLPTITLWAFS